MKKTNEKYVAFLRGINVGGHHKVPMLELRKEMESLGFENIITLLNSGNVIFDAVAGDSEQLETTISTHLEGVFGFPVPTIIRTAAMITGILDKDPFKNETLTKDTRWYVSFLRSESERALSLPWASDDNSFRMLNLSDNTLYSVLDLSISKTPKGMEAIERFFGKDITTRNWNTINRIQKKLSTSG